MKMIMPVFDTSVDTLHVRVSAAAITGSESQNCLLSLSVPCSLSCVLDQVAGEIHVSDLDSTLTIKNAYGVTIQRHMGSCAVSSLKGNVRVEIALPDKGYCRVVADAGDIFLALPANSSAIVTARSSNGTVDYAGLTFSTLQEQYGSVSGMLGTGNGEIRLQTKRGSIHLTGM